MIKKWSIKIPNELFILEKTSWLKDIFDTYTGTLIVDHSRGNCFFENVVYVGGEHESDDAGSQLAVAKLIEMVMKGEKIPCTTDAKYQPNILTLDLS